MNPPLPPPSPHPHRRPKMANLVEGGKTPLLPPEELAEMGYSMAMYPLTLMSSAIRAMETALGHIRAGRPSDCAPLLSDFEHVKDVVGFNDYYEEEDRYRT